MCPVHYLRIVSGCGTPSASEAFSVSFLWETGFLLRIYKDTNDRFGFLILTVKNT